MGILFSDDANLSRILADGEEKQDSRRLSYGDRAIGCLPLFTIRRGCVFRNYAEQRLVAKKHTKALKRLPVEMVIRLERVFQF